MNILDIIILICLVPSIVQGLRKGFISQAISIVSILAGVWASARFTTVVCEILNQYIPASEQVLKVIAFALIMIVVFLILGLVGKLLEKIFSLVLLGWINKLLGVVFSVFKCLLILGFVAVAYDSLSSSFDLAKPGFMSGSVLYPYVKDFSDVVFPYLKNLFTLK